MSRPQSIHIGVFAHNEADRIGALLAALDRQDIFAAPRLDVQVTVLANGCDDATVAVARGACAGLDHGGSCAVVDLAQGGKSRTWTHFVHSVAPQADVLVFCDADITLHRTDTLQHLVTFLLADPALRATSSRPVKDIATAQGLPLTARMIVAAGGTLHNWRKSISGQLYALRGDTARGFHLPIGLPVEDGFVRAMVLTQGLQTPEDLSVIDGTEDATHLYASERSLRGVLRHQVRIVIGSAVNAALFRVLKRSDDPPALLAAISDDPDWVATTLKAELPRRSGYVPLRFATKRLRGLRAASLKGKAVIVLGFGFDLLVYGVAQVKMWRGTGAGYW